MIRLANLISYQFSVRVRYAPSPTGMMHIGGLRTALFNQLFAKKNNGQFILRIQDTDQNRNVAGSTENIYQTLSWLKIYPDESPLTPNKKYQPYVQSQRLTLYKNIQKMLLKNNLAYPCFCEHQRKTQSNSQAKKKRKQKPQKDLQSEQQIEQLQSGTGSNVYDGTCSKLTFPQIKQRIQKGEQYAVRLKGNLFNLPEVFVDQNYGTVPFAKFDDFVIIKKDGWPTFHFANVVDDWKMEISHVIRGEQWLTNTSKHIYLYKVLGATIPRYLHLPLIQNQHGKKLAKRDPSSSLVTLKKQYEADAIKNFIFRLGWNPKKALNEKQQIDLLSDEQMIQVFTTEGITKSPAKFDIKILNHLNKKVLKGQWKRYCSLEKMQSLQKKQKKQLFELKQTFIQKLKLHLFSESEVTQTVDEKKLLEIWEIIHDRITINSDIKQYKYFFYKQKPTYDQQKTVKDLKSLLGANTELHGDYFAKYDKLLLKSSLTIVHNLRLIIEHVIPQSDFNQKTIAQKISQFLFTNKDIQNEELYHLLRFIMIEQKSGPSILKVMIVVGRERSLSLLENFHQMLKKSEQQSDKASQTVFF